jgi:hypothetical protein
MNIEQENTIRALKDQNLIAKRQWWCYFGFHLWTKWTHPKMVKRGLDDVCEQYRECACCGKYERKVLFKF